MRRQVRILLLLTIVVLFMASTLDSTTPAEVVAENPVHNVIIADIEFGNLGEGESDMYSFWVL